MPRTVGMRAPVCIYCGSPNPRPLTEAEWAEVIGWAEAYGTWPMIRKAIEEYKKDRANA
jgi:hypothetical protein